MKTFRFIYLAIFVIAVAVVFFLDVPLWGKVLILAWTVAPLGINEYQMNQKAKQIQSQNEHASNSLQDNVHHDYREKTRDS